MFFFGKIISLDTIMLARTEGSFSHYYLNSLDLASCTNLSWSMLDLIQETIVEPLERLEHGKQHRGRTSFGLVTAALAEGTKKQTGKLLVEDAMQNVSVNTQLRRVVFGEKKKRRSKHLRQLFIRKGSLTS